MRGGRRNSPPNREERFLETETAETLLRAGARAGSLLARFPQNGGFSGGHWLPSTAKPASDHMVG